MHLSTLDHFASLSGNALKDVVALTLHSDNADAPRHRRYLMAALDPSVRYFQTGKLTGGTGYREFDYDAYNLLDRLASRELSGNAAKQAFVYFAESYTPSAVELMNRALNKDLRCGVAETLINSLDIPDFTIPVFKCQLAAPTGDADEIRKARKRMETGEWVAATKYDGMRGLGLVDDNSVQFVTRSGKPIPALQHLEKQVLSIFGGHSVVIDCEGVGVDFLDSISQLRSKSLANLEDTTLLQIFDCVGLDRFRKAKGNDKFGGPLRDRLARLKSFWEYGDPANLIFVDHVPVAGFDEAKAHSDYLIAQGLEGAIAKDLDAGYSRRRTNDWIKFKATDATTVAITGLKEGEKGKQFEGMLGSATVNVDGVDSDVGMGWTKHERAAIWAAYTGKTIPVTIRGKEIFVQSASENYVIGRLIDVTFNERMPSGALRHARKTKFRDVAGEMA